MLVAPSNTCAIAFVAKACALVMVIQGKVRVINDNGIIRKWRPQKKVNLKPTFSSMQMLMGIYGFKQLSALRDTTELEKKYYADIKSAPTEDEKTEFIKTNPIPVYNTPRRFKYMLSKLQDFGDGGAFSEIHYAQYPLDMAALNLGTKGRIIRMMEMPVHTLELPKFKHNRVPKANGSPPVPVMHSPPRSVTVKDQQDWKIPPCISKWKNPKRYTIPLDKHSAADARGLQEVQINANFQKLSEALYVAEQKARGAVATRRKLEGKKKGWKLWRSPSAGCGSSVSSSTKGEQNENGGICRLVLLWLL
nr:collinsiaVII-like protein [Tanacetum cinerariifolium]